MSNRKTLVRQSKVRHLFGTEAKPEKCYTSLTISTLISPHYYVHASTQFLSYSAKHGVAVVPIGAFGRGPALPLVLDGHNGRSQVHKFSPFYDNLLATGGAGGTGAICLWAIDPEGLQSTRTESDANFPGHGGNIDCLSFNNVVDSVIASGSKDKTVKVWNLDTGDIVFDLGEHGGSIFDITWNYDGTLVYSSSKDRGENVKISDPRANEVVDSIRPFEMGSHGARLCHLGNSFNFAAAGHDKGKRVVKVFDTRKTKDVLGEEEIDRDSGQLMMLYDEGVNVIYTANKGGSAIKYFEVGPNSGSVHKIGEHRTQAQTSGFCLLPKRMVAVDKCEVSSMLQLSKEAITPISFVAPRKSPMFQSDLYPSCFAGKPAMKATSYFKGDQIIDIHATGPNVKKKTTFVSKKPILMKMDKLFKNPDLKPRYIGDIIIQSSKTSNGTPEKGPGYSKMRNALKKTVLTTEDKLQKAEARIKKLEAKLIEVGVDPKSI